MATPTKFLSQTTVQNFQENYDHLERCKQEAYRANFFVKVGYYEKLQNDLLEQYTANSNFSKFDIQRKMLEPQNLTYTNQHQNKGNPMVEFKKGRKLQQPEVGVLMIASKYSDNLSNIGFLIHTPEDTYEYSVNDCYFDYMHRLTVSYEAVMVYRNHEFTMRLFSIDSMNRSVELGKGSHKEVRLSVYTNEGMLFTIETTITDKSDLLKRTNDIITTACKRIDIKINALEAQKERKMKIAQFAEVGKTVKPELTELQEEEIELKVKGSSIQEKFISIVGEVSQLTQTINANTMLGDNQDIVESFIKAKEEITKLASSAPNKVSGFLGKYFDKSKTLQKIMKTTKDIRTENDSIQNNINHLFGIIHSKYERLVTTGESLQKTKALLVAQVDALEKLLIESEEELSKYSSQTDIPMNDLRINTQIKASVEKYRQRLVKIDSAIMATQTTIIALGKELPAMKTDLTDEMAIGSLLSNVDDYQHMFQEIAELVSGVAKATSEQTHTVIENLMDMQINDTHTMDYLAAQKERGDRFIGMVTEKSQLLVRKVNKDAQFISEISKGNTLEYVRKKVKLLDN